MKWLVLGGWALPPEICAQIFGTHALYIDTNLIAHAICDNGALAVNWQDRLRAQILPLITEPVSGIVGFSMGSLMAMSLAAHLKTSNLVLLSSTACFCRRPGYLFGWKPAILDAMRSRLRTHFHETINVFLVRCGTPAVSSRDYSLEQLDAGLIFLRDASMLDIPAPSSRILALHGTSDVIIPVAAAQEIQKKWAAHLELFDGGHLFFTACVENVVLRMNDFLKTPI